MNGPKDDPASPKGQHGGARPGAGRPRKPVVPLSVPEAATPLEFLLSVMRDPMADPALRVKAATTAAQYVHTRLSDGGKKDEKATKARKVAKGKFASAPIPLRVV